MATQYGIDMGNVFRAKMAADTFNEEKRAREAARQRNKLLTQARGQAATGSPEGMEALATLDAGEALAMQKYLTGASKEQREQLKRTNEATARSGIAILQSTNPEKTYKMFRESAPEAMREKMPERFDPDFVRMQMVARAKEIDDLMKAPDVVTFGGEDVMYRGGEEIDRTASNALLRSQAKGAGARGGLKASDENAIYRQAVELMGGIFDASGNVQVLDPTVRPTVQAIAQEATRMMIANEAISLSDAVARASQQFGQQIPRPGQPMNQLNQANTNDPLGIRR